MRNLLREESDIFREYRRYKIGAFIVVALIPMFYACIFLGSIWDPFQHLKNLPVAYANEDSGMIFRNKEVHLGADVMKEFIARGIFSFREYPSAEAARAAVRMGDVYFALVLPKDFSEKSLVGSKENPGLIHLILSEGLGFTAAMIGQRVGNELTHKLNERLNQRRWEIVFSEQDHAGKSLQSLQYALRKLSDGTKKKFRWSGKI